MISAAESGVGSAYTYSGYNWTGDASTSEFTCSGLVDYAPGNASQTNTPESLYAAVNGKGNLRSSVDGLSAGDLVFYEYAGRYPGHVGIYIGNARIIDSEPTGGVQIRDVYYPGTFLGGGSL